MSKNKVGELFHYPNTFLLLIQYAKVDFIHHIDRHKESHKDILLEDIIYPNHNKISSINGADIKIEDNKSKGNQI